MTGASFENEETYVALSCVSYVSALVAEAEHMAEQGCVMRLHGILAAAQLIEAKCQSIAGDRLHSELVESVKSEASTALGW